MNDLIRRLAVCDPRSGGDADAVADEVIEDPGRLPELLEGLHEPDDLVRARSSHAVERVSRYDPELIRPHVPALLAIAETDPAPIVRWHLAMIPGNVPFRAPDDRDAAIATLEHLLSDENAMVRGWAIVSLTLIAERNPERKADLLAMIGRMADDPSPIVRGRVERSREYLGSPPA
jgi:HEAT repeat protein